LVSHRRCLWIGLARIIHKPSAASPNRVASAALNDDLGLLTYLQYAALPNSRLPCSHNTLRPLAASERVSIEGKSGFPLVLRTPRRGKPSPVCPRRRVCPAGGVVLAPSWSVFWIGLLFVGLFAGFLARWTKKSRDCSQDSERCGNYLSALSIHRIGMRAATTPWR